jgi:hypothetical protein
MLFHIAKWLQNGLWSVKNRIHPYASWWKLISPPLPHPSPKNREKISGLQNFIAQWHAIALYKGNDSRNK